MTWIMLYAVVIAGWLGSAALGLAVEDHFNK